MSLHEIIRQTTPKILLYNGIDISIEMHVLHTKTV